jgi:hypothetical protein
MIRPVCSIGHECAILFESVITSLRNLMAARTTQFTERKCKKDVLKLKSHSRRILHKLKFNNVLKFQRKVVNSDASGWRRSLLQTWSTDLAYEVTSCGLQHRAAKLSTKRKADKLLRHAASGNEVDKKPRTTHGF